MKRQPIVLLLAVVVLAACGSGGDPDPTVTGPLPDPVCITGDIFPAVDEFIGLTEPEAVALAEEQLLSVREVGRDGECFPVTDDFREDRINLEFSGDRVVAAAVY